MLATPVLLPVKLEEAHETVLADFPATYAVKTGVTVT